PCELAMIFAPVLTYWTFSTFLYAMSVFKITSVELHRIPTDQKLRPANRVTVSKVLRTVAMQHAIQIMASYAVAVLTRPSNIDAWRMESLLWVLVKIGVGMLMMDAWQYWMHRWFHTNRYLYKTFHSIHHELTVPFAYGALYNHPLEGILLDMVGGGVPSVVLNMHPWTSALFFSFATLKTVDDHCGYTLPWDPLQRLFRNNAAYHDRHHWGKGIRYNYSQPFFTHWDIYMGTDYE
ncbi:fatty acid hydroxylase superfamily-domain-containing protein, partial [Blyttiomyces helicus]